MVGLITPELPHRHPCPKIAPALAFGNCVVIKPADGAGLRPAIAEIISRAGFPAGVFNPVMGRGREVGEAIVNAGRSMP